MKFDKMLLFSERLKISKLYEEWISKYNAKDSAVNLLSFLHGKGWINEEKAKADLKYFESQKISTITEIVDPPVQGHWIKESHEWDFYPYFYNDFTCSNCGVREQDKAPYCRYCGAKMKEEV